MNETPNIARPMNIPIDLCLYSVQNNCVNQLKTYCYLKSKCDGYIKNPSTLLGAYLEETGNSERTFYNHKKWLLEKGWLVKLKNSGVRVISFKNLIVLLGKPEPKHRGAKFIFDFHHFKSFVYAAVITYVGRTKKYYGKRAGAYDIGSASQKLFSVFNLPHTYLAKVLGVSKSTAQKYRKYAQPFFLLNQPAMVANKRIKPSDVNFYRQNSDETYQNLVVRNGKVYEQLPSVISCDILIKRWHG